MRIWALFLIVGQAFSINSHAQTAEPKTPVYRVDVHMVLVDTQILNKKTRHAIPSLKATDFQVYEDNILQRLKAFSQDTMPLSIVLLFDLTDSVRPVLKSLAEGALVALQHLKPEDEVTVMVYAASAQVLQEATTDRALAVAAIERASHMESDEAAYFNEGIFQAAEQLTKGKNPSSRRVIIWLTGRRAEPSHRKRCRTLASQEHAFGEAAFPTGRDETSSTNIDRGLFTGQEERAVCGGRSEVDVNAGGTNAASSR